MIAFEGPDNPVDLARINDLIDAIETEAIAANNAASSGTGEDARSRLMAPRGCLYAFALMAGAALTLGVFAGVVYVIARAIVGAF